MLFKSKYILFLLCYLVLCISSQAQNYADKKHYLIDSLEYDALIDSEKKLVDSSLVIYHKSTSDSQKLEAIKFIVENSWDDNLWPKYNQWVYDFTKKKINEIVVEGSFKNLSEKEKGLLKHYSSAINNFGVINVSKGNLTLSLDFFYKSLMIREKINDTIGIPESYLNIASIYHTQGNRLKDLEFNNKALVIAEKFNLKNSLAVIYNNLGVSYSKQNNNDKALEFHNKSLAINSELKSTIGIASSLSKIGKIYIDNGNLTGGLKYLQESFKVIEEYGYQAGVISVLTDIASVYFEQGNINLAKTTAEKAMKVALKYGDPERIMQTSLVLSSIYKKNDNWEKAFEMQEVYIKMRDSIQNNEIEKSLIQQQSKYDLEKKEQKIELLSVKNEMQKLKLAKNKNSMILISIAFFLALVTALVSFRGYKKKQYINKLLERQKKEISRQNDAKKTMLQEIHHRVKNNLQVVNSLLRLQAKEFDDEEVVEKFSEARHRVLSMAKLHEKMYGSDDLLYVDIHDHFKSLIEGLIKNYSLNKIIKLDVTVQEVKMGISTLTPLGLMINEFVTNSLKYAFVNRNEGKLFVHIKHLENKYYEMIIGDDGIGLSETITPSNLGSKLIKIFVKQLGGSMERLDQPGTVYKIILKKIDKE